ncbi:hypothetical protein Q1695_005532 [Nippostrongylus brasiliensis]|nr:hypothetical protein Q1695_005532 [Nippostrongylus brasiliensis]
MHHSRNRVRIGGPGVTVQLDKTLLTRRKCNRGRVVRSHQWLFGGIGVGCGRAFLNLELIGGQLWECIVNMREVKQLQSECVQLPKSSDAVVTRLMEFVNKQTHTIVGMAAMVSR